MLAFTNTIETKKQALACIKEHQKLDAYQKGIYWENGKGCAVGCLYHKYKNGEGWHEIGEKVHGIPKELNQLQDQIFEALPNEDAMKWPEQFIKAIPEGVDLSKVWNHFAVWLLVDSDVGVIRFADDKGRVAIKRVAELHEKTANGKCVQQNTWDAAYAAAWAAASDAASDAARSAAEAARDAAYAYAAGDAAAEAAAAEAAEAAAWAAADAAAGAARAAAYQRMAKQLLKLLKEAPIK